MKFRLRDFFWLLLLLAVLLAWWVDHTYLTRVNLQERISHNLQRLQIAIDAYQQRESNGFSEGMEKGSQGRTLRNK